MLYQLFKYQSPLKLESGKTLSGFHLAYTSYGELNATRDNVVWIFHALTANSDPAEWWPGLVGRNKFFNPEKYFIICVNMPGSCYGSIGPLDVDDTAIAFHNFPLFTTRDMIRCYQHLKQSLGIRKIHIGIGGSMGGQQLLEWATEEPELFEYIFPLATNAKHSPWGIAFNASQRFCIESDTSWKENNENAGLNGMKIARSVALLSYRHYGTYQFTQSEQEDGILENFKSESYQRYQGEKLAKRFNAFSYYQLSKSMDSHNIGRGRGGIAKALSQIKASALVIGLSSDLLFPIQEQQLIASYIPFAHYREIQSEFGHDGFLLEYNQIQQCISTFVNFQKRELSF